MWKPRAKLLVAAVIAICGTGCNEIVDSVLSNLACSDTLHIYGPNSIAVGASGTYEADEGVDDYTNDCYASLAKAGWSSSDTGVVAFDPRSSRTEAIFTAVAPGQAVITATADGQTAMMVVTVSR